jgi:hypothetical protein
MEVTRKVTALVITNKVLENKDLSLSHKVSGKNTE